MLANIPSISNDDPHVYEMKVIPTIERFIYVETIIMHTGRENFSGAKIKGQNLMLRPRLFYMVISHNILP
jgi:hypothetical protein